MTLRTLILAATLAFGAAGVGQAATLQQTYDATSAVRPGDGASHSLWIAGSVPFITGIGRKEYHFTPTPGAFVLRDDGIGTLSGRVVSQAKPGSGFDVMFSFAALPDHANPAFKDEGPDAGGPITFIDMVGGTLQGFGLLAGLELDAVRMPADYSYATQIGLGANAKNNNFGMAFWMSLSCRVCEGDFAGLQLGQADINVDLTPNGDPVPIPNPVPLPAGGLLLISALGGMTALRRRKT